MNDFLKVFPMEILAHILTFVKSSENPNHWMFSIGFECAPPSKGCIYADYEIKQHFQELEEEWKGYEECWDWDEEECTWFDYHELSKHNIDCVDIEEEFFNTHCRAY